MPEEHVLDENRAPAAAEAAESDPYVLRIRETATGTAWMGILARSTRLVIDIEE